MAVTQVKATTKPKIAKAKRPPTHPPFYEMVSDAILTLKERNGSSQYAIQKFVEEKHKQLPVNFKKQLLTQLKKFVASGKLVKVKNSYKLPAKKSAVSAKPKPTIAAKKPTPKKAVSKVTKAVTKPKAKAVAKPKSAASKPKATAVKRKAVKPKAKPAKVAKKAVASSPSAKAKVPAAAKATKVPVKKIKRLSTIKSPAKRSAAKKAAK